MTDLYVMRHGRTEMNRQRRMQGHIDCPLDETGRAQAIEAAAWFSSRGIRFDRVYTSPLLRAKESAMLVSGFLENELRIDERLIEFHYGPFEGKPYEELDAQMVAFIHDPAQVPAPEGVERISDLTDRVAVFLRELQQTANEQETLLLMVHGIVIRAMFGFFNAVGSREMWQIMTANCSIYHVPLADGQYGRLTQLV